MLWAIGIKQYLMWNETMGIWVGRRVMLVSFCWMTVSLDAMQEGHGRGDRRTGNGLVSIWGQRCIIAEQQLIQEER
jgi:hypothetical protein